MRPRFLVILVIAGVAYVLGARAGRERYEQMKGAVTSFWNDPTVKQARKDTTREAQKARKAVQRKLR
ncbi:hypothetical protein [Leifsonia poae]|uniref:hypothetical protein n=1 Tax=Leifsonia poae TaxID=110933 RepID=UPI001CBF837E|nr:hypothetical protein [Leifsonia poae]